MSTSLNLQLTDRDEAILTDLYFTRLQSTEQIARRYFKTFATAKRKLHSLKKEKGVVIPRTPQKGLTVWTLNKRAFERELQILRREGEPYREWPKPRAIPHLVDTNDIYIEIADDLTRILGDLPEGWDWKNEAQAWRRYDYGGVSGRVHQPDAEIRFAGNIYFLERQTHRARKTAEKIEEKLEGYQRYRKLLKSSGQDGELEVVFACDAERDMDYALEAAKKYGVAMTAGTTGDIAEHLLDKAKAATEAKRALI